MTDFNDDDSNREIATKSSGSTSKTKFIVLSFLLIMASGIIFLAVFIPVNWGKVGNCDETREEKAITFGRTTEFSGNFEHAAVSADSAICSSLGTRVLKAGGNAVDAAIVTLLCSGVQNFQSCGIGGGSFMMINDEENDIHRFINCREKAPASADKDMFKDGAASSVIGGMAAGIPGEMKCASQAHTLYGKLEWKTLIDMIAELAENDVVISSTQAGSVQSSASRFNDNSTFLNPDGQIKNIGDPFKNLKLAETFKKLSNNKNAFYESPLAEQISLDIIEAGGIVTVEDIKNYETRESESLFFDSGKYRIYVPGPPSSGVVFAFIYNIMSVFNDRGQLDPTNPNDYNHKLVEAFKFAYGKRTLLGDPFYQEEGTQNIDEVIQNLISYDYAASFADKITDQTHDLDYYEPEFQLVEDDGTSHMNVVDEHGMAVSITSTINTGLGAKVIGTRTGIFFNNEMDDFSTPGLNNAYGVPPSPANFISPGKQPMSSMTPIIAVDRETKKVKFMGGGSGGTRITTATAAVAIKSLLFDLDGNESVQAPRLHHQLLPDQITAEARFDLRIKEDLASRGHAFSTSTSSAVIQTIKENNGYYTAVSDHRKNGKPDGY